MIPFYGPRVLILVTVLSALWKESLCGKDVRLLDATVSEGRAAGSSIAPNRQEALENVLPAESFECTNRAPGYYADPRFQCEVFQFCSPDGSKATISCSKKTAEEGYNMHKICAMRDQLSQNCGQREIYLGLLEDIAITKDTTSAAFNAATDFKFQKVLPQPTLLPEEEDTKPTTPLAPNIGPSESQVTEKNIYKKSKLKSVPTVDDVISTAGTPFVIENIQILPSSLMPKVSTQKMQDLAIESIAFGRNAGSEILRVLFPAKESVYSAIKGNQGVIKHSSSEPSNDESNEILKLLEAYNNGLIQSQVLGMNFLEQKSKNTGQGRYVFEQPEEDLLIPTPRRKKRAVVQEMNARRPYAIFYAKVPETPINKEIAKPTIHVPSARIPDESQQTVELTFDPTSISRNIQAIPIAIKVSPKQPKKSRPKKNKKPKPQVIYENPEDIPQEDLHNPIGSEQRNYYYYYPQDVVDNPYLRQNSPSYVITPEDHQIPYQSTPSDQQEISPQSIQNNIPNNNQLSNGQHSVSPPSGSSRNNPIPASQNLRNVQAQGQEPDQNILQLNHPSSGQIYSQRSPLDQEHALIYGRPDFMQNLPPPYENLPTYQNVNPQPQVRQPHQEPPQQHQERPQQHQERPQQHQERPQQHQERPQQHQERPQQQHQVRPQPHQDRPQQELQRPQHPQHRQQQRPQQQPQLVFEQEQRPQLSPPSQTRQNQRPVQHSSLGSPQAINELEQNPNRGNSNNNQNGNSSPPREFPPVSDANSGNQQQSFGFFPSGFQSPFFQGFPPLPDFGNPFLPQPQTSGLEQFPGSNQLSSPPQQFENRPNVQLNQQQPPKPPQELSRPQAPPSPPVQEQHLQRPQGFVEDNGQRTVIPNERRKPNRRAKRPRPQVQAPDSVINDANQPKTEERRSRQRSTRPPNFNEGANVIIPSSQHHRPRQAAQTNLPQRPPSPDVTSPQFNGDANIIVSQDRPRSYVPRPDQVFVLRPGHTETGTSDERRFRHPEQTGEFSTRPEPSHRERIPQSPPISISNGDNQQFTSSQNGYRPSRPVADNDDRHVQRRPRPTRPPTDDDRRSHQSQNRHRPSRPVVDENDQLLYTPQNNQGPSNFVNDNDLRAYRPQSQSDSSIYNNNDQRTYRRPSTPQNNQRPSGIPEDERVSGRPHNSRRPSRPIPNEDERGSGRPHNSRRPSIPIPDEDERVSGRPHNSRRPSRPIPEEDERLFRRPQHDTGRPSRPLIDESDHVSRRPQHDTGRPSRPLIDESDHSSRRPQNTRKPSRLTDNESHRSRSPQNSENNGRQVSRPSRPLIVETDHRSRRPQSSARPLRPVLDEDDKRSYRPNNGQRQRAPSSENNRSRRPSSERRPDQYSTTLPPRISHTTQVHTPRDLSNSQTLPVVVEEYRNLYYPATTSVPYQPPTPYEYTVPQTYPSRPLQGEIPNMREPPPESYRPSVRPEEKTRYYVTPQDSRPDSNIIRTERPRVSTNNYLNSPYIDYIGDRGKPVSENQVNIVPGSENYDSRTYIPPRAESFQDYDSSRERGRARYTTSYPAMETGFQPVSKEDPSYVTRSPLKANRNHYGSNSVENNDQRNRYKDDSGEIEAIRLTTSLPKTTRKPKPIPPRPTFPSFPTFPPPPKRRTTTTTEAQEEIRTVTESSRIQKYTEEPNPQQIPPKKRLNSRPRTPTSVPVVIGTSTSVRHQIDEKYDVDVDPTTTRSPQRKRNRKRTRPRHRKPRTTTTPTPYDEESSASFEDRKEQSLNQPTRKSYKRRGSVKVTTTTPIPTTIKQQEPDSSEEYGSRIKLFGRQRSRKTTSKYSPWVSTTTPKTLESDASEPHKTLKNSENNTSSRPKRPYRKRTRVRTTAAPDTADVTDLNIARSDEHADTLEYRHHPRDSAPSTTSVEETTTDVPPTEPYNEFLSFAETENVPVVTERTIKSPDELNYEFETTQIPANRVRLLGFGKPRQTTA